MNTPSETRMLDLYPKRDDEEADISIWEFTSPRAGSQVAIWNNLTGQRQGGGKATLRRGTGDRLETCLSQRAPVSLCCWDLARGIF